MKRWSNVAFVSKATAQKISAEPALEEREMTESPPSIYKSVVYVLSRDGTSNVSKVGSTRISSKSRASDYTDGGWTVFFELEVAGPLRFYIERTAHEMLTDQGYWLDPGMTGGSAKELFTCHPNLAKAAVENSFQKSIDQMIEYIAAHPRFRDTISLSSVDERSNQTGPEIHSDLRERTADEKSLTFANAEISYLKGVIKDYENRLQIMENNLNDCRMHLNRIRAQEI